MEWFYAVGNEQKGPVFATELLELKNSGKVNDGTLVWRDGMADWIPMRDADMSGPAAGDGVASGAVSGEEMAVCAYSGKRMPKSEMIAYGDKFVASEYKDAFVQRLHEGVIVNDPAELIPEDYTVDIGSCFSRAWQLLMSNFWPIVGITFLIHLINWAAQQIYIGTIVLYMPLMGGLQYYYLLQIRGYEATIDDSFSGFRFNFGQLALLNLVVFLIAVATFIPGGIIMGIGIVMADAASSTVGGAEDALVMAAMMGGMVLIFIPMTYLLIAWMFAALLCIDRKLSFWPAMKVSMKTVHKHLFWCLWFGIVKWAIALLGFAAVCVGAFVTFPLAMIAATYLYEDIYGSSRGTARRS